MCSELNSLCSRETEREGEEHVLQVNASYRVRSCSGLVRSSLGWAFSTCFKVGPLIQLYSPPSPPHPLQCLGNPPHHDSLALQYQKVLCPNKQMGHTGWHPPLKGKWDFSQSLGVVTLLDGVYTPLVPFMFISFQPREHWGVRCSG